MRKLLILSIIISLSSFSVFGQWHDFNKGLYGGRVRTLLYDDTRNLLYAGTITGTFISENKGLSWAASTNGLPSSVIVSIQKNKDRIYILSFDGVYTSVDGKNWSQFENNLLPNCIAFNDTSIFIGTYEGPFYSNNNGVSWKLLNSEFSLNINKIAVYSNVIFVNTPDGFYKSEDNGISWNRVFYFSVNSIEKINNEVFVCSDQGLIRSGDNFNSWTFLTGKPVHSVKFSQGKLYISTNYGIEISGDYGHTWVSKNIHYTNSLVIDGSTIVAGTETGIFRSEDEGNTWISSNNGLSATGVEEIAINSGNILAGTVYGLFVTGQDGNWIKGNLDSAVIKKIVFSNQKIYTGTSEDGLYLSVDAGNSWMEINNGITNLKIQDVAIKDNSVFAATDGDGIFVTQNDGNNWRSVNNGLDGGDALYVSSLAVKGGKLFAGTWGSGVFVSENNGQTWATMNKGLEGVPQSMVIRSMRIKGDTLLAGTNKGLYVYSNYKKLWSLVKNHSVDGILRTGDKIFTYNSTEGIYMSEDDGKTWIEANDGLYDKGILALASDDKNIYTSTAGHGIWTRLIGNFKSLHVAPDTIYLAPGGNSRALLSIKSNTDWVINDTLSWISFNTVSGNGNTNIQIIASGNDSDSPRSTEISITASGVPPRSFYVVQKKRISTNELNNDSFVIYPNPTENKVYIDGLSNDTDVRIFDISGNLVKAVRTSEYQVNISDLRTGTYFMKWNIESKTFTKKLIKK
jgi:ligand-binding sensor domain-containing protein